MKRRRFFSCEFIKQVVIRQVSYIELEGRMFFLILPPFSIDNPREERYKEERVDE